MKKWKREVKRMIETEGMRVVAMVTARSGHLHVKCADGLNETVLTCSASPSDMKSAVRNIRADLRKKRMGVYA